ncbi:hypothetical protein BIV57_00480 [Mangrovactinospora gilvigrisea]|uniref:Uncharacterized protein n=1 Tax=Mangrovactinospora gilvigrisea TaxID=1428644 RepID=A0A1J7BL98_9ACTN|nr:hypothetical protein [Mangrovactinospora gilvigrisea]OIV39357.1 hypothetical protein BIV57_00480 [Mangrovactinospora gilvigrisea]
MPTANPAPHPDAAGADPQMQFLAAVRQAPTAPVYRARIEALLLAAGADRHAEQVCALARRYGTTAPARATAWGMLQVASGLTFHALHRHLAGSHRRDALALLAPIWDPERAWHDPTMVHAAIGLRRTLAPCDPGDPRDALLHDLARYSSAEDPAAWHARIAADGAQWLLHTHHPHWPTLNDAAGTALDHLLNRTPGGPV